MKVLTIIENNRITGVVYGNVEVEENVQTIKHCTKYTALQNQIRKQQYLSRTRHK